MANSTFLDSKFAMERKIKKTSRPQGTKGRGATLIRFASATPLEAASGEEEALTFR